MPDVVLPADRSRRTVIGVPVDHRDTDRGDTDRGDTDHGGEATPAVRDACCAVLLPTGILDEEVRPGGAGPLREGRGQVCVTS